MQTFIQRVTASRHGLEISTALILGALLGLFIYAGGNTALLLLYALSLAGLLTALAYSYPVFTLGLWMLLTEWAQEIISVCLRVGMYIPPLKIGAGIDVRYADPIVIGVAGALLLALASGDRRSRNVLFGSCLLWSALMCWLLFQVARSVGDYGIVSALGEFRSTFEALLILPYVLIFIRTREQQWHFFCLLLVSSLLFIGLAVVAGGMLYHFSFAPYEKWLRGSASLALACGAFALLLMNRHGLWTRGPVTYGTLMLSAVALIIIAGHRSVWMAAAAAIAFLVLFGHISLPKTAKVGAALLLCIVVLDLLYTDIDLWAFLEQRLIAFTAFSQDNTATWRVQIWQDAWQQSQAHLWEGKGFGNYFRLYDARGNLVTVSLHNMYIQFVYQVGLVGLLLYLAFVMHVARKLWKSYGTTSDRFDRFTALLALTVLVAASAFCLAYSFTPTTWLYIGLGLAVAQSRVERTTPQFLSQPDRI